MEYLKNLWAEARPLKRAVFVIAVVAVVLGLSASAVSSSPLDDFRELPGVTCDYVNIERSAVEQCVTKTPVACVHASQYPEGPRQFGEAIGLLLFHSEELSGTETLYLFMDTEDDSLGYGFVYNRDTGTVCMYMMAHILGEAL